MYILRKLEKKKEFIKNKDFINGNGDVFYRLEHYSTQENIRNCFYQLFSKDSNGIFKISFMDNCFIYNTIENADSDYETIFKENVLENYRRLPYTVIKKKYYHSAVYCFDNSIVIKTDNYEDIISKAAELNIILFEPYIGDGIDFDVKINKNNFDICEQKIDNILSNINMVKIEKVVCNEGYRWFSYLDKDDNLVSNSDSSSFFYTDENYSKWKDEHFHKGNDYYKQDFYIDGINIQGNPLWCKKLFFVSSTDDSISFTLILIEITIENNNAIEINLKKINGYSYSLCGNNFCKKYLKTKEKDISPVEMFGINSQTIHMPVTPFIFNNASNVYDFIINNSTFFERCGFLKLLSEYNKSIDILGYIVLYFSIIFEYPVIELIVKIGHTNLVEDIFSKLLSQGRKESIIDSVKELEQLINNNTTKGYSALRFPSYIGDYLMTKKAKLREYFFWRDIYEITNISKENFEKFLESKERIFINASLNDNSNNDWYNMNLQEIVKYNYDFNKTIKYLFKITNLDYKNVFERNFYFRNTFNNTAQTLADTLRMGEELDFNIEKYPDNLHQIHNQLAEVERSISIDSEDPIVKDISTECSSLLEKIFNSGAKDLPIKAMAKYTYLFPTCQKQFTQEGQDQHNCVAGYFNRVKNGDCIIFFVREKGNPDNSYITAEIKRSGIGQVMYSNNRPVPYDTLEYQYCRYISNKILKGIERNEILAINKISKRDNVKKKRTVLL